MAKTNRPIIRIHNVEIDEVIDREMNDDEFAQYEADKAADVSQKAELQTKAEAKQTILDRIGLTADELKMILG